MLSSVQTGYSELSPGPSEEPDAEERASAKKAKLAGEKVLAGLGVIEGHPGTPGGSSKSNSCQVADSTFGEVSLKSDGSSDGEPSPLAADICHWGFCYFGDGMNRKNSWRCTVL